jgi:hypothetical protein
VCSQKSDEVPQVNSWQENRDTRYCCCNSDLRRLRPLASPPPRPGGRRSLSGERLFLCDAEGESGAFTGTIPSPCVEDAGKEGLIGDNFIKMIMVWQHVSGFNVHNQVRIKPDDEKGMENLSQYIKERRNQRAPPAVIQENTELIWIVPYDDGWPNYEEPVFEY